MIRAGETTHVGAPGPSSLTIQLGDRQVRARHAHESGINSFEADCAGCGEHHAIVTICFSLDSIAPPTRAIYLSLTPDQARDYAASLLAVANEMDGGGVRQ
ncbi:MULTISPECIES: hypothetical protein [unclassified Sphingomonas]|uniref:hypothetical protein n=1 Tax=unclassified Sphingomonas TaxID=196159 RepID=UPI0006F6352B|nr:MULTISPECIES: hypothetical protein [unclassified Sphingomonas]KQX19358.1 hypothetical protein ASD17_12515 [Sphingomonas sp. Root1294]KQY65561.1 hypothetical protein ASD39_15715 [Sphingomonas sp. Root50]KRB95138.1 hypothetical protein ASE22_04340 [Sphingomonas sp. Root720]